jgi:hypothetical protein
MVMTIVRGQLVHRKKRSAAFVTSVVVNRWIGFRNHETNTRKKSDNCFTSANEGYLRSLFTTVL